MIVYPVDFALLLKLCTKDAITGVTVMWPPAAGRRNGSSDMVTRTEAVTRSLRQRVLEGTYAPGARLNEMALAESLSVSRTPIRAALGVLFAEGLLDYEPNCGYVVRSLSLSEAVHIYAVRATLEGLAARLAAEAGPDAPQRQAMRDNLDEMRGLVLGERWEEAQQRRWGELNRAFHALICALAGNGYLTASIQRTLVLPLLTERGVKTFEAQRAVIWWDRSDYRRAYEDHRDIGEAIFARQGSRAEAVMREHIDRAGRLIGRKLAIRSEEELALP
jgi:GntR family transcriptional regulator of vanillate catabolism